MMVIKYRCEYNNLCINIIIIYHINIIYIYLPASTILDPNVISLVNTDAFLNQNDIAFVSLNIFSKYTSANAEHSAADKTIPIPIN